MFLASLSQYAARELSVHELGWASSSFSQHTYAREACNNANSNSTYARCDATLVPESDSPQRATCQKLSHVTLEQDVHHAKVCIAWQPGRSLCCACMHGCIRACMHCMHGCMYAALATADVQSTRAQERNCLTAHAASITSSVLQEDGVPCTC